MFRKVGFRRFLGEYYPLLLVLVGVVLVSGSLGPFENGDTSKEFLATKGVMRWAMPYVGSVGAIMDEPPLGYYIEALWFLVFGVSMVNGVALVTLFGLGCTVLVYLIGKVWFSRNVGLLAAVLFALSPWEFVLSRSFLIDTPCLFFSLLFLLVGILAIRKNSFRLIIVSGFLSAAAFLTKFYAVFSLIPLLLFYVQYSRPKRLSRVLLWVGAFSLPMILLNFLWYHVISGQGLFSFTSHQDFVNYLPAEIHPSYLFVINFLLLYGLGYFFAIAIILSLVVGFVARKRFSEILVIDMICLVSAAVVGVDTFLGAYLHLNLPYAIGIKYNYQSLPYLSLVAASLGAMVFSSWQSAKSRSGLGKRLFSFGALGGAFLLAAALFVNIYHLHLFSTSDYLLFRVEWNVLFGYSLLNPAFLVDKLSFLMGCQYLGFGVIIAGLVLAIRRSSGWLIN